MPIKNRTNWRYEQSKHFEIWMNEDLVVNTYCAFLFWLCWEVAA
jgi:hypothetical protein